MENSRLLQRKSEQKSNFVPYEDEHIVQRLKLVIIVVRYGQAKAIEDIITKNEISMCVTTSATGGSFELEGGLFGVGEHKKQTIFTIVPESKIDALFEALQKRFLISKAASGIAYSIPLSSVAGVTFYKFLSNTRKVNKVSKNG